MEKRRAVLINIKSDYVLNKVSKLECSRPVLVFKYMSRFKVYYNRAYLPHYTI